MATSGQVGWAVELANDGWWDPGGYWYTESAAIWEARFTNFAGSVDAGLLVYRLELLIQMGDLSGGIAGYLVRGDGAPARNGVVLASGSLGGCGTNEFGGAADCGLRQIAAWETTKRSEAIRPADIADLRGRAIGIGPPHRHYLFGQGGGRFRLNWYAKRWPAAQQMA